MKMIIGQPVHEEQTVQLEAALKMSREAELILFPEGYVKEWQLMDVCHLAEEYSMYIVAGYKDSSLKDRAFIADPSGRLILDRNKTPEHSGLYQPSKVESNGNKLGFILCREVFQGLEGLGEEAVDFIFNPIGVGMFSEHQFEDWTSEARNIARSQRAFVIGASHADGSYRNCGFSIPIAYCFDPEGNPIFIHKSDERIILLDTERKTADILGFLQQKI
ncbi:hypothetical protein [Peribacillus kribbensis]|uniref:hypothetical protein n=1 Tax=Peribacillus kribbensis TaxID=356658 RepID=UPI00040E6F1E|nr:hypothetical protein [Peribacillus kribbensis]